MHLAGNAWILRFAQDDQPAGSPVCRSCGRECQHRPPARCRFPAEPTSPADAWLRSSPRRSRRPPPIQCLRIVNSTSCFASLTCCHPERSRGICILLNCRFLVADAPRNDKLERTHGGRASSPVPCASETLAPTLTWPTAAARPASRLCRRSSAPSRADPSCSFPKAFRTMPAPAPPSW